METKKTKKNKQTNKKQTNHKIKDETKKSRENI
jgi:hypothetical protein